MNKLVLSLILGLFSFWYTYSQSSVWIIEGNGSKIYVGGTIHMLRDIDYPMPPEFEKAYESSGILVLESQLPESGDNSINRKMRAYGFYPKGKSLKTVLSEKVYKELEDACIQNGIPLARMNHLKPSMIILNLTSKELKKMGVTAQGVDMHYFNKATQDGKQVSGLETVEEHLKIMADMGKGDEDNFVEYSLKDIKENRDMFDEFLTDWRDGTAISMHKELHDLKNSYPELYNTLLVERNNKWLPQLEEFLETDETEFVLFGALHLYGKTGVLNQMKGKGYKVEQLRIQE